MTDADVQKAVAEELKELCKLIEKQNRILESIDASILRGMYQ